MNKAKRWVLPGALALIVSVPAAASTWGGHYGTINLSFAPGPEIRSTAEADEVPGLGTTVDLYAVFTVDVKIAAEGEQVLTVGGLELKLAVEGAPGWRVVTQEIPVKNFNIAKEAGSVQAGLLPGISFANGPATLVHWALLLPGHPHDVVFRLDPAGVHSCESLDDCKDSGTVAMWSGSMSAGQAGLLFSAAYVPAYLNWTGETPDLAPVHGKVDWSDTGQFTEVVE